MRRAPLNGTLSLVSCLNQLSSTSCTSLHSGFQDYFILDLFCSNAVIILVLFFQIVGVVEFTRPNFQHISTLCFLFSVSLITLTFPLTLKTFLLFVTVAILSRYQPAVNCKRNVRGNFTHKVNYRCCCNFHGLEVMWLPESIEGLPSRQQGNGRILKIVYFLENCIGTNDW